MKTLKMLLDKIIYPTCALATLLMSVFQLIIFNTESSFEQPGLTPSGFGTILLYSFVFVFTCQIFRMKVHLGFRVALHFLVSTATFVICFIFLGGYYASRGAESLYITFFFALIYAVIAVPALLIRRYLINKKNEKENYESMLTKTQSSQEK